MRYLVLILAALVAFPASADLVARAGDSSVRLTAKDCPKEVLQYIPPISADGFHEAQAIIDGKSWVACWLPVPDGVFLMFSDGDQSAIPFDNFKDEKGV